jgi:hypothetical protein
MLVFASGVEGNPFVFMQQGRHFNVSLALFGLGVDGRELYVIHISAAITKTSRSLVGRKSLNKLV